MDRRRLLTGLAALPLLGAPLASFASPAPAADPAASPEVAPQAPRWPIAPQYYPTEVDVKPELAVGSIIVVSDKFFLYHITAPGKAMRYGVAVGKAELKFRGQAVVARKVEWPSWKPTPEMVERSPSHYARYAETGMPGGPRNPLGARAMYLFQNGHDTAIRIHGTVEPSSIGHAVSNGCLRMVNDHVIALYDTVPIGTPVTVY
ncbi:L,D-transpeptidase [Rhodobacter lacus]|uniref:L,D-transpeptidase n=1 Tax=Rhodobacter lacus TaxID=1641972 RepID=A0ABW5A5A3_9RHOB